MRILSLHRSKASSHDGEIVVAPEEAEGSPIASLRIPLIGTPAIGTPAIGTPAIGTPAIDDRERPDSGR